MEKIISKELLSEVYPQFQADRRIENITSVYMVNNKEVVAVFSGLSFGEKTVRVNIHELAHKCKEWALQKGKMILIEKDSDEYYSYIVNNNECLFVFGYIENLQVENNFIAGTEPEAIFKACQWILDEKTK